jgi:hypothetical protein
MSTYDAAAQDRRFNLVVTYYDFIQERTGDGIGATKEAFDRAINISNHAFFETMDAWSDAGTAPHPAAFAGLLRFASEQETALDNFRTAVSQAISDAERKLVCRFEMIRPYFTGDRLLTISDIFPVHAERGRKAKEKEEREEAAAAAVDELKARVAAIAADRDAKDAELARCQRDNDAKDETIAQLNQRVEALNDELFAARGEVMVGKDGTADAVLELGELRAALQEIGPMDG